MSSERIWRTSSANAAVQTCRLHCGRETTTLRLEHQGPEAWRLMALDYHLDRIRLRRDADSDLERELTFPSEATAKRWVREHFGIAETAPTVRSSTAVLTSFSYGGAA